MILTGVDIAHNPSKENLDMLESKWMWSLKTHNINGGLNIDEPYLKNTKLS